MSVIDTIFELFERRGGDAYFGEPVSQLEHALQAAALAEQEHAPSALIAAALLHDVGHLTHGHGEDVADRGLDARHEDEGYAWLSHHFGPAVTEPVRLHVAAKRYLCAVDADYFATLSPASVQSLELQGGPYTPAEVTEFERNPHYADAVHLRHWDDQAKIPGLAVPPIEHYRSHLEAALAAGTGTGRP